MITILHREEIYNKSIIADLEIANRQQFYFSLLEGENPDLINELLPIYDHLEANVKTETKSDAFLILAFDENLSKLGYEKGLIQSLFMFFLQLGINEILMVQDLCNNWQEFGFLSKKEKKAFLNLTKDPMSNEGLLLDLRGLQEILPLLFHSNPDKGDFSLYSQNGNIPFCMLYWEDNFHISFFEKDRIAFQDAAKASSLLLYSREEFTEYFYGKRIK